MLSAAPPVPPAQRISEALHAGTPPRCTGRPRGSRSCSWRSRRSTWAGLPGRRRTRCGTTSTISPPSRSSTSCAPPSCGSPEPAHSLLAGQRPRLRFAISAVTDAIAAMTCSRTRWPACSSSTCSAGSSPIRCWRSSATCTCCARRSRPRCRRATLVALAGLPLVYLALVGRHDPVDADRTRIALASAHRRTGCC